MNELQEEIILMVVGTAEEEDTPASLDELEELTSTAGAITVARIIQNRGRVYPGICLGKGKVGGVRELLWDARATGVARDDELSPAQLRNLEDTLDTKVMNRTMVILDIFASWTSTRGGKIQVELTQLKYGAVRLVGMRNSSSRLGDNIGTRGPDEKRLETGCRLIHQRIGQPKEKLADVKRHQEVTRQQREKNFALPAAVVDYTNAGKSTLLNRLTEAGILVEDKLFATLDPTTRSYTLEDSQQVPLTDTVGLIRKLPHHLIEAFKSMLEKARYSDIVLHVMDCSDPQMDIQMRAVKEMLKELEIVDKTIVTVFNKMGRFRELGAGENNGTMQIPRGSSSGYQVRTSVRTEEGLEELQKVLQAIMRSRRILLEKVFPYSQAGRIRTIRKYGQLLGEGYQEDGIAMKAYMPAELFGKLHSN